MHARHALGSPKRFYARGAHPQGFFALTPKKGHGRRAGKGLFGHPHHRHVPTQSLKKPATQPKATLGIQKDIAIHQNQLRCLWELCQNRQKSWQLAGGQLSRYIGGRFFS
jgi:hypothetical protein